MVIVAPLPSAHAGALSPRRSRGRCAGPKVRPMTGDALEGAIPEPGEHDVGADTSGGAASPCSRGPQASGVALFDRRRVRGSTKPGGPGEGIRTALPDRGGPVRVCVLPPRSSASCAATSSAPNWCWRGWPTT